MLLLLLACSLLPGSTGDTSPIGGDDTAADTGDSGRDTGEDPAIDDERVRGLTGLPEGDDPAAEPYLVRIQYTVDGDTFYAEREDDGEQVKVRMIGVNTPEVAHEDAAECFGNQAWTYTAEALENKLAWLTFDAELYDDYDRVLAYVIRDTTPEGFFNRNLARNGYAYPLTIYPNDSYADEIADDVAAAQGEGLGLWSACE